MKDVKVTCYIRKNRTGGSKDPSVYKRVRIFPWLMETYPDVRNRNKILQRRDFECRTEEEAVSIAKAVYGDRVEILKDSPLVNYEN